uniref:ryncolin-1-like isoform X2 n=1 Tax=Ciona intestinalis TaxID=7719 RepID=UPI000EF508BE|nr:ryncolin-1-like isoform X2 [Ciona intestinalis]|eukprot:XP_018667510.2 ryncolin-1-like isoform X2 [Ciona intestinalis]
MEVTMSILRKLTIVALILVYGEYGTQSIGTRGKTEIWCHANNERKNVTVSYRMCLNEAPVYVNATVKPTVSSLPNQFKVTVKKIDRFGFLAEILRVDHDSGWESLSLTVDWFIYMRTDMSSCQKLYDVGYRRNGLYDIYLDERNKLEVYCDLENHGSGWTVIQRNMDNRTDFDRNWLDYKTGFGNKLASFWIGLENIRALTKNGDNELRIDITTCNNTKIVAEYTNFMVGPESDRYRLNITGYQHQQGNICNFGNLSDRWQCGGTGITQRICEQKGCCFEPMAKGGEKKCFNSKDGMAKINGHRFSTKDINNNVCPKSRKAGWWYNGCTHANLNGIYDPCKVGKKYAYWRNWHPGGIYEGLRFIEMKIRPHA